MKYIITAFLFLTNQALSDEWDNCRYEPMVKVIANPEDFEGKKIYLEGKFIYIPRVITMLYMDDFSAINTLNQNGIRIFDKNYHEIFQKFNQQILAICGVITLREGYPEIKTVLKASISNVEVINAKKETNFQKKMK